MSEASPTWRTAAPCRLAPVVQGPRAPTRAPGASRCVEEPCSTAARRHGAAVRHVGLGLLWFLALAPASTAQTCAWCEAGSGAEVSLEGVIDLHAHSAPDSGARSIDAITIAQLARDAGMRALLFKNHYTHTASLAYIVSKAVPGIELYRRDRPELDHRVQPRGGLAYGQHHRPTRQGRLDADLRLRALSQRPSAESESHEDLLRWQASARDAQSPRCDQRERSSIGHRDTPAPPSRCC